MALAPEVLEGGFYLSPSIASPFVNHEIPNAMSAIASKMKTVFTGSFGEVCNFAKNHRNLN